MSYNYAFSLFICFTISLATGPSILAQETETPVPVQTKEASGNLAEEGAKEGAETGKDEVTGKLRQQLLGAWIMAPKSGADAAADSRIGVQQKFFGLGHWIYTLSDPETGELVGSHGGTYTLKGDEYEETIVYAAFSTEEMIGQSFKFKLTVDGDRLMQRGIGNRFNEDYIRLKANAAEPKK